MGWNMSSQREELENTHFKTMEEAIEYCNRQGYQYYLEKPNLRKHDKKSYADNFKWKGPG